MKDYIESQSYTLTVNEESYIIKDINYLLSSFETVFKKDSNESKIMHASVICEYMTSLLLKKKGYILKNTAPLSFIACLCEKNNLIPRECVDFLKTVSLYRTNSQGLEAGDDLTSSFLKAFSYFIRWFNRENQNKFEIEKCCNIIDPKHEKRLYSTEVRYRRPSSVQTYFDVDEPKKRKIKRMDDIERKNIQYKQVEYDLFSGLNTKLDMILELLSYQNDDLKRILEISIENLNLTRSIEEKINNINDKINLIQSQTEKLLNNADDEDEIEKIIQVHTSQYIENILESKNIFSKDEQYNKEKIKLIDKFGKDAWNKLSEDSKTFLITSKYLYNQLIVLDDVIDYSGVCVLITKALEVEIFKRFFINFLEYLDEKYGNDYSKYHSALLYKNKSPLKPEKFTMGNIAFVLCLKKDYAINYQKQKDNEDILMEYCKKRVFSYYIEEDIRYMLKTYAKEIEDIKVKYRNPSAHRNQVGKVNAKECFDLVVDVEKLLKKMLDSFDE